MRCYSDQGKMPVAVRSERMTVRDYAFTGSQRVMSVEGVSASGDAISYDVERPTLVNKVVEREGEICCTARSPRWAGLKVCSAAFGGQYQQLCEEFEWTLARR